MLVFLDVDAGSKFDTVQIADAVDAAGLHGLRAVIDSFSQAEDVTLTPAMEIDSVSATLSVVFRDHKDADTAPGLDPYFSERDYDPYEQGTFWGKFRARQPFLRGRAVRWISSCWPSSKPKV